MTVRKGTRWGVVLLAVVLVVAFVMECTALGQSVTGEGSVGLVAWAQHDRCYQHAIEADSRLRAHIGRVSAEAYLDVKWWGACDSKVASSFLNAEAGRVIQRSHGVILGSRVSEHFFLGGGVIRSAVQHFWRNEATIRKDGFPSSGSARTAKARCEAGRSCPSIGYYEGLRVVGRYNKGSIRVSIMSPHYTWKNLTLPWPGWIFDVSYHTGPWVLAIHSEVGGIADPVVQGSLEWNIFSAVVVGARYGTTNTPGWDSSLHRLAVFIEVGG